MPYEKLNIADVFIENIETGNVVEIKLLKDRATLTNFIENQKYIDEVCEGIPDYNIIIDGKNYYIKSTCSGIRFENHDAHLSNDDMQSIMQIIEKSL